MNLETMQRDGREGYYLSYNRSAEGVATRLYSQQVVSSIRRGHHSPKYTKLEFREWFFAQDSLPKMMEVYKESGHDVNLKPSADRIDDEQGYTMENIQLITWGQNRDKEYARKKSSNNKLCKAVIQSTLDGVVMAEHVSLRQASRDTGCDVGCISQACSGINETSGGYLWSYKLTKQHD